MITHEDMIEDAQRVHAAVEGTMTLNDYREHGSHSVPTLSDRFDGIGELREMAGIDDSDISTGYTKSRDELLTAIHDLADELGRVPKRDEMIVVHTLFLGELEA